MLVDGQSLPGCYIPFLAQLAAQANSSASSNWKSPSMKSSGSVPKDRSGSEDHSGSEEDRLGLKEDSSKSQIPPGLQAVALTSLASFLALCPKAACEHKHLVQKALSSNQHNEVKLAGLKAAAKLALCAPNEYLPVFKLVEDLVQQSANDDNSKAEHANCKRSISASQAGKHCNETEARQKEKAHPSGVDMTINRYRTLPEFSTEAYRAIAELLLQGRLKAESYLGFVGNGIADSHPGIQRLMVHTLQRLLEMSGKGRIKMVVDLHTQTRASCRKRLVAQLVGNLQFLGKRRETACDSGTRIRRNPKAGSAADIRDMDSNCRSATGVDSNFSAVLTQQDLRSDELAALLLQKLCAGQSDVAFFLSFVTPSKRALLTLEANVQATPPKLCVRSLDPLALDDLMQFVSNAQHAKRGTTESAGGGTNVNMVDAEDSAMPASTLRQLSANIMRLLRKERSMATDHRHSSRSSKGATQIGMDFLKRKREQHDTTTTQKMQKKDEDGDWGVQFGNAVKGINVNDDNRESLGREKDHPDEELTEGNGNLQGGAPGNRQQLVIDHYVKAVEGFKKKPDMEMRIADILREV
ncbi:hypothetical protein CBR_g48762 [Chara braunii]|uniref:Uncharacterized protein n=1 Tax=Chara braunii TaxID=69332 RepID=A0A388M3D0_CHABU|nr:hypothetical protein CBR_g48762 [Chara braunii]|eukprot:GBG89051.1 hypothetical protein CBR_g48762 [Chara braunii]